SDKMIETLTLSWPLPLQESSTIRAYLHTSRQQLRLPKVTTAQWANLEARKRRRDLARCSTRFLAPGRAVRAASPAGTRAAATAIAGRSPAERLLRWPTCPAPGSSATFGLR